MIKKAIITLVVYDQTEDPESQVTPVIDKIGKMIFNLGEDSDCPYNLFMETSEISIEQANNEIKTLGSFRFEDE